MVFLQGPDVETFAPNRAYAVDGGCSTGNRSNAGHMMVDCRTANRFFVKERFPAERCIDDEVHLAALDVVDDVRPALVHFINRLDLEAGSA